MPAAPNPALLRALLAQNAVSDTLGYRVPGAGMYGASANLPTDPGPPEPDPLPGADVPEAQFSRPGYGTVVQGGPDFANKLGFVSTPGSSPGTWVPFPGYTGKPSLYDTQWTYLAGYGWVPQAQAAGNQANSGRGSGSGKGGASLDALRQARLMTLLN